MKYLGIIILLFLNTCQNSKREYNPNIEDFHCSTKENAERPFFKMMKSISYFKNQQTGKKIKREVRLLNDGKHTSKKESISILFDIKLSSELKRGVYNKITMRNDSIFLSNNFSSFNLLAFKSKFSNRNNICCQSELIKIYYDKKCKDSVYQFKYNFRFESHNENEEGLREVWASKKRGILKVIYQDSIGDLWEGKYYPPLAQASRLCHH